VAKVLPSLVVTVAASALVARTETIPGGSGLYKIDKSGPPSAGGLSAEQIERWSQGAVFAKQLFPALQQAIAAHDREVARQVMLETALGLELYYREHGTFPESLQSLVGPHFDHVPADPFGHGEDLRYGRDGEGNEGVLLWSIGPDRADDLARVDLATSGTKQGDVVMRVRPPRASSAAD